MIFLVDNTIHADTAALRSFAGTFVLAAKKFLIAPAHTGVVARARLASTFCKILLIVFYHNFEVNC